VEQVFGREIARASTPTERVAVARTLAAAADNLKEPAEKWAMLAEAVRLAVEAGSLQDVNDIIERLSQVFRVDGRAMRVEALGKMALKPAEPTVEPLAMECLKESQHALAVGSYGSAAQLAAIGQRLARRTRNSPLLNQFNELSQQVRSAEKRESVLAGLLAKHAAAPEDPDVLLELGKHYCFQQAAWAKGLPLLAKGDDPELKAIAVDDAAAGKDGRLLVKAADDWVTWARKQRPAEKKAAHGRAAELYGKALPSLEGLERLSVRKKLEELVLADPSTNATIWLADLKPLGVNGFNVGFTTNGTYLGKPYTCDGVSCERSLLAMSTGGMKPAVAKYPIPAEAKRLVGAAGIFPHDGVLTTPRPQHFEIKVDGRSVWQSPPLSKANSKETFDIVVAGGSELELITMSEQANCAFATWINPAFVK
jgi:hypothetical protein